MVRTQVQFTKDQFQALRRASAATGKSVAELVRLGMDQYLAGRSELSRQERVQRALRVAGRFSSGRPDVSSAHDRHLADAFRR